MAESTEAKIVVSLIDQASEKLKKIDDSFDSFNKVVGENAKKVGAAMTVAGGAITAMAVKSVSDFSELGDAIEKMATRTGMGAEAVSAFRVAADASGTSIEAVETGIRKMQMSMLAGEDGIAALSSGMEQFGIALSTGFFDLDPSAQFEELAQKIGGISDPAAQTQAAIEAFGKAGTELIPMFEDGSFNMDQWKQKADELGVLMTDETAASAAELNDKMGDLNLTMQGLWTEIGSKLAPIFIELADKVQPIIANISDWMSKNPELTTMILTITAAVGALLLVLGPLIASLALLPSIAAGATLAFTIMSGPIGIVIGVISALIFVGTQLALHWDWLSGKAQEFSHNIAAFINGAVDAIRGAWDSFWYNSATVVTNAWNSIKNGIEGGINWIIDKINGLLSKVNSATSMINKLPGVDIPQINEIPALAEGGIVTKPTIALIGEAGPEAVVPLSKAGNIGGAGGISKNTTINVYANGDNNADLISRLNLMYKML